MAMKRKHLILIVGIALLAAAGFALKEFTRGHADVAGMKEAHAVDAPGLLAAFVADEAAATARFVGQKEQALKVSGTIRAMERGAAGAPDNVVLETGDEMAGIVCEFAAGTVPSGWTTGDAVAVKGICQGYTGEGMMPGDVLLQRCVPVE